MISHSPGCDRFIPSRLLKREASEFSLHSPNTPYQQLIKQSLCPSSRILSFDRENENDPNAQNLYFPSNPSSQTSYINQSHLYSQPYYSGKN